MSKKMTKEQLHKEAQRMAEQTGFSIDVCRSMLTIGEHKTRRDKDGRLLADSQDIEDALLDGDEVMEDNDDEKV